MRRFIFAPLLVATVGPGCGAGPEPPQAALSAPIRQLLGPRMARHGEDLKAIEAAVRARDFALTERLSRQVADEPRVARPLPEQADTLNEGIPQSFFVAQDRLARHAGALADAATRQDPAELDFAFDDLKTGCAVCHTQFQN